MTISPCRSFPRLTSGLAALLFPLAIGCPPAAASYIQSNLVANSAAYDPLILQPEMVNAWGIAIRPAGFGGHFWVTSNGFGTSNEFVGDAGGVPLFQDGLKFVMVPGPGGGQGTPTGVVFNGSGNFVITQSLPGGPTITGPSRFMFVTDSGTLSAWTEQSNPDGSFTRPGESLITVDKSAEGVQYFGLAISRAEDRLFAANFGANPGINVFDAAFGEITASFAGTALLSNPFAADGYQPFNVQALGDSLFVAYAKFGTPGEEEAGPGLGRLAEFGIDGSLIALWDDGGYLNAPWGLAVAPGDFGPCSNALLVSNFGDGTIACFDRTLRHPFDYIRDPSGALIAIEGIWGLIFGNGASLGEADRLYFAAGPEDETAGVFGSLSAVPGSGALGLAAGLVGLVLARLARRRPLAARGGVEGAGAAADRTMRSCKARPSPPPSPWQGEGDSGRTSTGIESPSAVRV